MANLNYITENKLTLESDEEKYSNRKFVVIIGCALAIGALFIHYYLSGLVLFLTFISYFLQSGNDILDAGAVGEDITLNALKRLPDSYTIYNQVDIPNSKSRTGFNEADLIVVGPNAVFVIEVKHNNGSITGSDTDRDWEVLKLGRGGTGYSKTMRNPISQVKKLVWLLSENLKSKKSKAWIQGVVLFSNNNAELTINNDSNVQVVRDIDIVNYIKSYKSKSNISNISKITQDIAQLKSIYKFPGNT